MFNSAASDGDSAAKDGDSAAKVLTLSSDSPAMLDRSRGVLVQIRRQRH